MFSAEGDRGQKNFASRDAAERPVCSFSTMVSPTAWFQKKGGSRLFRASVAPKLLFAEKPSELPINRLGHR
jgi:hypothetical protein